MVDVIELSENLLKEQALKVTPEGTDYKAVVHQWLHAFISDSGLFADNNGVNRQNILNIIRHQGVYIDKKSFCQSIKKTINIPPPKTAKFRFVDLFAGIGGMRIAAQNQGGTCVFSSEFDRFAQKTYLHNYGELPFGDITKIDEKLIPDHDMLIAGFPCQPFSYAGKCEGFEDQTRGTLFFDVLRIAEGKNPKIILLENVKGFKSHQKGNTMRIALNALKEIGYTAHWTIINSFDFGVPQYRERWYCVAFKDENNYCFPVGGKRGSKLRDIVDMNNDDTSLKLSNFELERIDLHFSSNQVRLQHDNSKYSPITKKGRHGVFSFQKPDGSLRFHIGDVAKTQIQEAFYACLDTYAPTIIANRTPKMWDLRRKLSVKESCRLQGYPDVFKFDVSNAQAYKQLGNSVTVPVIESIVKSILELIGD